MAGWAKISRTSFTPSRTIRRSVGLERDLARISGVSNGSALRRVILPVLSGLSWQTEP